MDPRWRRRGAAVLLVLAIIGWPITQLTVARDEPPVVLGLSFLAIVLTCIDILTTTDVRAHEED